MAIKKTVQQATEKWQRRVGQAGQDYQAGVQHAQGWAAKAVAAAPRRNAGLTMAISDGRIDAGIQRAGDNKWRSHALAKGAPAYVANTPKAAPAYNAGMSKVFGFLQAAEGATSNMDTSTVEGRLAKSAAFLRAVHTAAQAAKTGRV